jgi:hypothetical protein
MHVGRCFGLRSLAAVSVHTGKAAVQDLRRLQRRLANLSLEKQQAKLVHRRGEIADKLVQRLRTALELEEGRMSSGGGGSKSTFVSVKHVNDDLHAWMTQQQQKY